jgi:hypothetical protein
MNDYELLKKHGYTWKTYQHWDTELDFCGPIYNYLVDPNGNEVDMESALRKIKGEPEPEPKAEPAITPFDVESTAIQVEEFDTDSFTRVAVDHNPAQSWEIWRGIVNTVICYKIVQWGDMDSTTFWSDAPSVARLVEIPRQPRTGRRYF